MASGRSSATSRDLAILLEVGTVTGMSDGELLDRFLRGPDGAAEGAFAALVARHQTMVFRACRQILLDRHDAEDASQATFLVLARKARSIRRADSVAGWLYGVACRISARARSDAARRRGHERRSGEGLARHVDDEDPPGRWAELHEELGRLPEKFRLPIVLFHFEGLSYEQAAEQIRCPVRTVQSRLARGRERLRARLARRGLSPTAALIAAALGPDLTSAAVTDSWKANTVKAAVCYAAGETSASLPPTVVALAKGALKAMRFDTLKSVAAAGIWVGVIASGLGAWARSDPSGPVVAENRHVLRMANGTRIEVVGVSSHPSGPDTWWRPDGRPLEKPPADPAKVDVDEDVTNLRAILIRVVDLPEGAVFKWRPTGGGSWGDEPTKDGRRLDGMQRYVSSFAANLGSCGVEVRVASGPWVTVCTHDNRPGSSATTDGRNRILFGVSREHRGGTSISLAQDFNPYFDRDTRVVAVDPEGHEHPAARLGMISGGSMSLVDAEFSLPPGRIRQYRLQARPFERGVIGDVSLTPRPGREE